MHQFADGEYPNIDIPLVTNCSLLNTLFYLPCLGFLHSITPFVTQYRFLAGFCKIILQTVPTFLYLLNLSPNALHALVYNLAPLWARPYIILASHGIDSGNTFSITSIILLALFISIIIEDHTHTTYASQTVVLNTLSHSSPPPTYSQAHFTAYGSEFSTNSQKVLYLAEKLTGILQNYNLFVSSLLSFSEEDKELSTPSASQFSGLTQGSLSLGKYNRKFCSLQSRLPASGSEACSFYKIGLNRLLQEFLIHYDLPEKIEPLIRELPKSGGGFFLTAKEVLRRRNNNLCSYCGSKDHLLPACPLSKHSPLVNKTSTLTLLSLNNTSKSPTVLVTIHRPLGKIKVLALLDTGANANFIEEKLAKLLRLPAFGSLDVKVGNITLIGATPILQPVTIDLEGSPFRAMCNSFPTYPSCSSLDSCG
ncbi:hypothetical protein DSO57_1019938 [Entomophthora muscae]|uniref:Uncharacterized protein n=1 Tax=Entomophthora muscae TaxID=34485 RepID=A0ACC2S5R2_9FUNG|nr:hypothetical protein DSO57_1019938 [Entomophthora muscae]